jgi:hypothetical protein
VHDERHGIGCGKRHLVTQPRQDHLTSLQLPVLHRRGNARHGQGMAVLQFDAQGAAGGGLHVIGELLEIAAMERIGPVSRCQFPSGGGVGVARGCQCHGKQEHLSALHAAGLPKEAHPGKTGGLDTGNKM